MSNQNVQLLRRFFEICNTHELGGFASATPTILADLPKCARMATGTTIRNYR